MILWEVRPLPKSGNPAAQAYNGVQQEMFMSQAKVVALKEPEIRRRLRSLRGWKWADGQIARTFDFKNYYQTTAFVNAVAWISHQENHHPDMEVGYNHCRVCYSTHSVGGLSANDFACAAKVNALMDKPPRD